MSRTRFERAEPILNVADLARSVRYYVDVLGFTNADWGGDDFTHVSRDDAGIYLSEGDQGHPGTWVWIGVEDVASLYQEYTESAHQLSMGLRNESSGPGWTCPALRFGAAGGHSFRAESRRQRMNRYRTIHSLRGLWRPLHSRWKD